jgi:hypothetical protein
MPDIRIICCVIDFPGKEYKIPLFINQDSHIVTGKETPLIEPYAIVIKRIDKIDFSIRKALR